MVPAGTDLAELLVPSGKDLAVKLLKEPIAGTLSYTCLQLVQQELTNILFIAFHTNAMGGHLNAHRTLHCLRLWFYWPGMYAFVKRVCQLCPGRALANPT